MAGPGEIIIRIGAQTAAAVGQLNSVNKALGDTMTGSQKMGAAIQKAAVPAAIALTAITAASIKAAKAAAEDEAQQVRLAGQLDRVTDATNTQLSSVEAWITKQEFAAGVADDQLRPALGKLATATGDLGTAQDALTVALDVSAQTGKSLESVTGALAKGYAGNTKAIGKLVPGMDKAILKSGDMTAVTAELSDLMGGAAAEHAATYAGQSEILHLKMSELTETLGAALLPALDKLMPLMQKGADFAAAHADAILVLVGAVAAVSGAIIAANIAMKAYKAVQLAVTVATKLWSAAQWLLNAALSGNPIGLVIVAVAALAAGIIYAYKHSETFRQIVTAAMNGVKVAVDALGRAFTAVWNAAKVAWDWIKSHWQVAAFLFGPLGVAIVAIAKNFDKVKAAGVGAFNAIKAAIQWVTDAINSAVGAVQNLIGWLGRIKVPSIKIPGISSMGYPVGATPAVAGYAAPGGVTVNVYGAIDPEGTARTIRRVLDSHAVRQGRRLR